MTEKAYDKKQTLDWFKKNNYIIIEHYFNPSN